MSRTVILQKKTLKVKNFQSRDSHSSPLFKSNHILKRKDKILIENILFINKPFNNFLPPILKCWFTSFSDIHNYQTVSSTSNKTFKPSYRTDSFGKKWIALGDINSWNKTEHINIKHIAQAKLKVYFLKNTLKTIDEEVERGKYKFNLSKFN